MRGITDIEKRRVPSVNGKDNFSLDQYQNRDNSRAKRKAAAWGNGDFKSVLRQNMSIFCDDYKTEVSQSIKLPQSNHRELHEAHTKPQTQENEGDKNGL